MAVLPNFLQLDKRNYEKLSVFAMLRANQNHRPIKKPHERLHAALQYRNLVSLN